MKTRNTTRNHGVATVQGRVLGTRAAGGLAAVTAADGTVLRVAEIDFTGTTIEEIADGVVQVGTNALIGHFRNNTPGSVDLEYGDVVVIDSDGGITTTTTPQDTRPVGVVQAPILSGEVGLVAFMGDVPFVKVTAAVTSGNYAETSDEATKATENPTRRVGSFGIFLSSGTEPSCHLFGASVQPGTAHTHDFEVLMQSGITDPATPLDNSAGDDWLYGLVSG